MSHRKNSNGLVIGVAAFLLLAAIAAWLRHDKAQQMSSLQTAASGATNANSSPAVSAITVVLTNSNLQNFCGYLQAAPDAAGVRKQLEELRAALAAMPKDEALAAIKQFLDSKADASTHLGFKVAKNGLLDEAPTLRTFLLDELERIDPAAAADYAKLILTAKDSPDEWAVALRNLARGDTSDDGRALLQQKTGEMLQYEPWQQNPSAGFLESFDAAVYVGGTGLMPTLTDLVRRQDNSAVAHASYLALDRLVINNPATTLAALAADPDSMQGRETTRADYFARADVRDPQQKQVLENYLLNPRTSPAEIEAFTAIFPNANYMISPNLLTQSQTPDHATLVNRDAESLRVVQGWITDQRFAQLLPVLEKTQVRLAGYVHQENQ